MRHRRTNARSPHGGAAAARRRSVAAGCLAVLVAAGCDRGDPQRSGGFSLPPLPVETAIAASVDLQEQFTTVGSLAAGETVTVVAEIDGSVRSLPFAEGEAIAAGALIAQLDDAELAAEVARAAAVRDQRRIAYERIRRIVEQRAGAPQDLDDAEAALHVATAEYDLARARLAKTRITAPFAGTTGRRLISPGAFLRAGSPITDLTYLDELRVHFTAPERLLDRITRGAPVAVTTTAFPDRELTGTIDVVDPQLEAATRSVRIVAELPNPDRRLRPGMSADVTVTLQRRLGALTVPSEAVFVQGDAVLLYEVLADSTVVARPVTTGLRQRDSVEILTGLSAGALVVKAGHQKLYPGARVVPVMDPPAATAAHARTEAGA